MRMFRVLMGVGLFATARLAVAESCVLEDFASADGWKVWDQAWGGVASFQKADSAPPAGAGALQGHFPGIVYKELTAAQTEDSASWTGYAGLSFWVKGDGSELYGCLALGPAGAKSWEQNFANSSTYACYFPLKDKSWHKVVVGWHDFVPEETQADIGSAGGLSPAAIRVLRLGNRWKIHHSSAPIPPHAYAVGLVQFEKSVPAPKPVPALRPFASVLETLKAKKPLRILCVGDSITAGQACWPGERYSDRLGMKLRQLFGTDTIVMVNRGVGAARISDARDWVVRDFAGAPPDLVTIMYGTNDSVAVSPEDFRRMFEDYLDRVAVATGGKTAVLLLATIPGGADRYHKADPMAQAIRDLAAKRQLPCCDLQKAFYDLGEPQARALLPDVHPRAAGHYLMAETIAEYIRNAAQVAPVAESATAGSISITASCAIAVADAPGPRFTDPSTLFISCVDKGFAFTQMPANTTLTYTITANDDAELFFFGQNNLAGLIVNPQIVACDERVVTGPFIDSWFKARLTKGQQLLVSGKELHVAARKILLPAK